MVFFTSKSIKVRVLKSKGSFVGPSPRNVPFYLNGPQSTLPKNKADKLRCHETGLTPVNLVAVQLCTLKCLQNCIFFQCRIAHGKLLSLEHAVVPFIKLENADRMSD